MQTGHKIHLVHSLQRANGSYYLIWNPIPSDSFQFFNESEGACTRQDNTDLPQQAAMYPEPLSSLLSPLGARDKGPGNQKWLPATWVGCRAQPVMYAFSISSKKLNSLPSHSPQHKGILNPTKGMPESKFLASNKENEECNVAGLLGSKGEMINHQWGSMTVEGKSASLSILFFLPSSLSPFKMNFKVLFTVESSLHALASCLNSASPTISASIQKTPVNKIEPSLKTNMGTSLRRFYAVIFILKRQKC